MKVRNTDSLGQRPRCSTHFSPIVRLCQAGGLPAISRWLREERAPPPDSADREPTIPEGWQRLPRSAAYPSRLASRRDAIYISIDRWYLPLRGINHRLIAGKPPACPVDMTTESCVEQQGRCPRRYLFSAVGTRRQIADRAYLKGGRLL